MYEHTLSDKEFWLLDVVVECRDTITALKPRNIELLQLYFNRKWHSMEHDELAQTLEALFQRGDLIAETFTEQIDALGNYTETSSGLYVPTRVQIETALKQTADHVYVYYGLTEQGGARWETAAHADWQLFVDKWDEEHELGTHVAVVTVADRTLVEAHFACVVAEGRVVPGSERWQVLEPWSATYWKTLPIGYRLCYEVKASNEGDTCDRFPRWHKSVNGS